MRFSFRLRSWRTLLFSVVLLVLFFVLALQVQKAYMMLLGGEKPIDAVLSEVERRRSVLFTDSSLPESEEGVINVLLLGLDARKGWESPHCDAIHLLALNTSDWSIDITSVPRGTHALLPPGGNYVDSDYYVSNACGFGGLEYGIQQIEKILGVQTDYYVTVGFSQVYGILRTFELPTTQSLQWLRHRQSFQIGDPQRSHNQAVFIKDMIIDHAHRLRGDRSGPLHFLLFNMVDTNMDFATGRALLTAYLDATIDDRPEDIRLSMKPFHPVVDMHFDFENPDPQIEAFLERIRPYLSEDDLSDKDLASYQDEIRLFLDEQIESEDGVESVVQKELWLQLEDRELRENYHYIYTEAYANQLIRSGHESRAEQFITDFILMYQALDRDEMEKRGHTLLRDVLQ